MINIINDYYLNSDLSFKSEIKNFKCTCNRVFVIYEAKSQSFRFHFTNCFVLNKMRFQKETSIAEETKVVAFFEVNRSYMFSRIAPSLGIVMTKGTDEDISRQTLDKVVHI